MCQSFSLLKSRTDSGFYFNAINALLHLADPDLREINEMRDCSIVMTKMTQYSKARKASIRVMIKVDI